MSMIKESGNKITIKEIAELAGVSIGTVDRVIHARGRVSEENRKKIEDILKEYNYRPNLLARSLVSKKRHKIVCILPEYSKGDYWDSVVMGILQAQDEIADYNIYIEYEYFNQYDNESFVRAADVLLGKKPDALLVSPLFKKEAVVLVAKLREENVPCVFIDSDIETLEGVAYFGQHSFQSGFVGADLMASLVRPNSTILACKIHRDKIVKSNQIENRLLGFTTYFELYRRDVNIQTLDLFTDKINDCTKTLKEALKRNKDVSGMITFNSKVYVLADFVVQNKIKNVSIVGYDLLEDNVKHLKDGVITNLLAQRPEKQGYLGIKALSNYLLYQKTSVGKKYLPIDILNKLNIDYYGNI